MGLSLLIVIGVAVAAALAQAPAGDAATGVSGYVLTPDGLPAPEGAITLRVQGAGSSVAIGRDGRFTVVPHAPGLHELSVSVPGFSLRRMKVTIPPSKRLELPPVRLDPATYLHVRLLSPTGEPLTSAFVLRQSFDVTGAPIWEPSGGSAADRAGPDGVMTIGPLPRGATTIVLDGRPFARMRLPDVHVTTESPVIDAGTVTVDPGGTLHVDLVDDQGRPVPDHEVYLEDAAPFSPATLDPRRTDQSGRATFERLGSGRYHVWTRSLGLCARRSLVIARAVRVSGAGTLRVRLVIAGSAMLRLTSSGVPRNGTDILLAPESPQIVPPAWLREGPRLPLLVRRPFWLFDRDTPCPGATDGDGRATLTTFPPGPARLQVRLPNALWTRRLQVPAISREASIDIPPAFMPIRIVDAKTGAGIPNAGITWTSNEGRVEATASATGDALLEGLTEAAGVLTVSAAGYAPRNEKLAAPASAIHEVALEPTRGPSLECRVVAESGQPIANAVVQLTPGNAMEVDQVATTDATGVARFFEVPPGSLRLAARAPEFVGASLAVAANADTAQTLVLFQGYRIVVRLASSRDETQRIRVLSPGGEDMDARLDAASDRTIGTAGPVSLGPLPPGAYIVEVSGSGQPRRKEVRIGKSDVQVVFD